MTATTETQEYEGNALAALGDALEAASGTIGSVRTSVTGSVRSAAGKVGSVVSAGAYHGAYGASYGIVFTAVFLKEFLPVGSTVRRGLEEGAEAAFDAVAARRDHLAIEDAVEVEAKPKPRRATKRRVPAVDAVINETAEDTSGAE